MMSNYDTAPNRHSYEPLLATGRISLAHNGSLVIRNADKSDEANYLCRATNNIGKPLEHSSPLKVNGKFEPEKCRHGCVMAPPATNYRLEFFQISAACVCVAAASTAGRATEALLAFARPFRLASS